MTRKNSSCRKLLVDQKGFLLIATLGLLAILSAVGTTAYWLSSTDLKIGGHFKNATNAFYSAEAGLAHSRRYLREGAVTPGFSSLLTGSTGTPPTPVAVAAIQNICPFGSGGGCYSVSVANNTPTDPDPQIDTDGKLWVTSAGTHNGSTQTARALMEFITVITPPAALDIRDGNDSGGPVGFDFDGTSFLVDGNDTAPPTTTGTCGTPGSPKKGVVAESSGSLSDLDSAIDSSQEPRVIGLDGNESIAIDNSLTLAQMQAQRSELLLLPKQNLSGSFSGNVGSPTAPVIAYANDSLDLEGSGHGYGILIVDRRLRLRDSYVWEGLVMVIGQGELEMEGTSQIYGGVVNANTGSYSGNSGETRTKMRDSAKIVYSSQALCRSSLSLPTQVLSWQRLD